MAKFRMVIPNFGRIQSCGRVYATDKYFLYPTNPNTTQIGIYEIKKQMALDMDIRWKY